MKRTRLRARSLTPPTHRQALPPDEYTRLRAARAAFARYRCEACQTARGPFDLHHVVKRSQGGGDTLENVVYLCRHPCHEQTDWPYAKGRLIVTPIAGQAGWFQFEVVTKGDKWSP